MKKFIRICFILIAPLFLLKCTSQSELKNKALAEAKKQFHETLLKEIDGQLPQGTALANNYIGYMEDHTKYDVSDIKMNGENDAVVHVQIEMVPPENRKTLVKIAAGLSEEQKGYFNMGNAINLIEQQKGQVRGKQVNLLSLKFRKVGDRWAQAGPIAP